MAIDSFLVMSNGTKGESQDDKFAKAIDVLAWSWGVSNAGTTQLGGGGGGGKMNAQDLGVTKYVDMASNDMIQRCADGSHFDKALLVIRKSGGTAPIEYWRLSMREVMVTSYSTGGSGDGLDRLVENITLNFNAFDIKYTLQAQDGTAAEDRHMHWDISKNVVWSEQSWEPKGGSLA